MNYIELMQMSWPDAPTYAVLALGVIISLIVWITHQRA